jgi:uncharacterized protein involved in exopolysaccharide biosynthesis
MTLEEILLVLRRRFWLIVAGALIGGAVAALLSLVWPPTYEAQALLLITKLRPEVTLDPRFETLAEENVVNLSIQDDQVRRQTLVGLAESSEVAVHAIDRLGDLLEPEQRSVEQISGMVSIETVGNLLSITAKAEDPAKAAAIANAWAEVYEEHVNRLYSATSPGYEQIVAQVDSAQADYETAKSAVEAYLRENPEDELTRQIEQKQQILANLQAGHLAAARQRVEGLLAQVNQSDALQLNIQSMKRRLAEGAGTDPLTPGERLALLSLETVAFTQGTEMSGTLTLEIGQDLVSAVELTGAEASEKLDTLAAAVEEAKASAQAELADSSLDLLSGEELLAYRADGAGVDAIEGLQAQINNLQSDVQHYQRIIQDLRDSRDLAQENYLTLARKAAEVQIRGHLTGIEVQTAAAALAPEEPAFPSPLIATALGIVGGGLAGLALAFLVEIWPHQTEAVDPQ